VLLLQQLGKTLRQIGWQVIQRFEQHQKKFFRAGTVQDYLLGSTRQHRANSKSMDNGDSGQHDVAKGRRAWIRRFSHTRAVPRG
jgi:hypothetical protein